MMGQAPDFQLLSSQAQKTLCPSRRRSLSPPPDEGQMPDCMEEHPAVIAAATAEDGNGMVAATEDANEEKGF